MWDPEGGVGVTMDAPSTRLEPVVTPDVFVPSANKQMMRRVFCSSSSGQHSSPNGAPHIPSQARGFWKIVAGIASPQPGRRGSGESRCRSAISRLPQRRRDLALYSCHPYLYTPTIIIRTVPSPTNRALACAAHYGQKLTLPRRSCSRVSPAP
jgi:hypothetical protein